jgi:hypothetical protein
VTWFLFSKLLWIHCENVGEPIIHCMYMRYHFKLYVITINCLENKTNTATRAVRLLTNRKIYCVIDMA